MEVEYTNPNVLDFMIREPTPVWSLWKRQPIVVCHGWVISTMERLVPIKIFNPVEIIGKSLEDITSKDLFVRIQVLFTTVSIRHVEFLTLHEKWIIKFEIKIKAVPTNVLSEIVHFVLGIVSSG